MAHKERGRERGRDSRAEMQISKISLARNDAAAAVGTPTTFAFASRSIGRGINVSISAQP